MLYAIDASSKDCLFSKNENKFLEKKLN